MLISSRLTLAMVLTAGLSTAAFAQLPILQLGSIFPAGARQGTVVDVTVQGSDFESVTALYFSHPAITAEKLPDEAGKPPRFKISVAADVPLGFYDVRAIGKLGISNPRAFIVGNLPEVLEQEPNNERAKAQRVELGTTVSGQALPAADVDWFVFAAKAGQRLLIECWGRRIDSRIDGFMTLYDATGRELIAGSDETSRDEKHDPLVDFQIPADGDYYLKFVDFTFNGSPDYFYRLTFGIGPLIDFVLPTGAAPGESTAFTLFGRNLPGGEKTDLKIAGHPLEKLSRAFTLSADAATTLRLDDIVRPPSAGLNGGEIRLVEPGVVSNAKFIVASRMPELLEAEPNNAQAEAQHLTVPCAVSGQILAAKDVDCFTFAAKKGEIYTIEVFASRIGSRVDPDLEVLNSKGDVIASVQDDGENIGQIRFPTLSRDLRYDLTPPEDGDYTLRLEHLYGQLQGGPEFVYRLELTRRTEDFRLICLPIVETRKDSHVLRQGCRERLDICAWRRGGHDAPITLTAQFPPGVTCEPFVIAPGARWATLVLSAAADAALGETEIEVVGTSVVAGAPAERKARGGVMVWDTVNTPGLARITRSIMLAVRENAAFRMNVSTAQTSLKAAEPLVLDVTVDRSPQFTGAVELVRPQLQFDTDLHICPGLEVPLTTIPADQARATVAVNVQKVKPGTYSFNLNGVGQVPFEPAPGRKLVLRCVYPSNVVTFTILPP